MKEPMPPSKKRNSVMNESLESATTERLPIEDMPLNSFRDYRLYNEEARKLNNKFKVCRYPIKQCPKELHPSQRVICSRSDGKDYPIPVFLSDWRIHFDEKLIPGKVYDLPECVIHHIETRDVAKWGRITRADGSVETRKTGADSRFAVRTIFREMEA